MKCIKKQIIITAIAVFIGTASFAQVTLTTQDQVDASTATEITGNLSINGGNITNLTSLRTLTSISGNLIIRANPNLISLAGLEGIENINQLSIVSNSKLTNLSGLDNLTSVTQLTFINNNEALTSLEGLEKLTTIGFLGLSIHGNTALSTLNGLNNLTSLGGRLLIGSDGLSPSPNPALINYCAISQLVTGDDIQITTSEYVVANNAYNPSYAQLGVAATCVNTTLTADLTLITQTQIDNLTPYTKIDGDITIKETGAGTITSLSGLTNITSITGNLAILSNMALTSLQGLGNLTALGGELQIGTITGEDDSLMPNMALIDFCAISDLVTGASAIETTEYFVENNAYNPTYMGLASGNIETEADTNDGCSEFGMAVVSTNTFSKEEDGYRLFPNPVSDILFVKSESKITSILISNVSGQEVLKSNSGSINVQNLSKGIYFARIVSGEKTVVEKFVKL